MTASMPDPDLVIRTASEFRISNFLLWHDQLFRALGHSKHWPEFREDEFREAMRAFARRDRRFGGLSEKAEPATQGQAN